MEKHTENTTKKPLSLWKKILIALGALLLIGLLIALVLGMGLLNRVSRPAVPTSFVEDVEDFPDDPTPTPAPTPAPTVSAAPTPTPAPLPVSEVYAQTSLTQAQYDWMAANAMATDVRNVLLIGVDRRGTSGNSSADTLMIATVDKRNGRLKLTSLMRDMLVQIPGQADYGKLNSAAALGGVTLLMQTVNENFHLNITEYVLVDFNMFIEIIDRMGGVTVKMSTEEISAANDCIAGLNKQWGVEYLWDGFIFADGGNVKLTGKQALGYARIRHLDSDFKRINRQYKVLSAVYATFRSLDAAKQYAVLYDLLPMVETNMQNTAILDVAVQALGMDTGGILQCHAPADDTYEVAHYARKSVLLTDLTQNALLIHQFIFEGTEEAEKAAVLSPGPSLPPRTPRPTYAVPDINGNLIYYYEDGTLVPGQDLVYPDDAGIWAPGATPDPQDTADWAAG